MPRIATTRGEIWAADQRRGDARPALLIHGAGGSRLSFPAELRLHAGFNPVLPDLPGHGKSAGQGRSDIAEYAHDMLALLDALEVGSAVLVGHSMGGAIAQWLALHYPERVAGLALICTGARLPVNPALIESIAAAPDATIMQLLRWMWAQGADEELVAASEAILRDCDTAVLRGDFLACAGFDIRAQLGEIRAPTLVVTGELDKMTPPKLGAELADGIPNARLRVIPGAGHMAHLEQPRAVASEIDAWLSSFV